MLWHLYLSNFVKINYHLKLILFILGKGKLLFMFFPCVASPLLSTSSLSNTSHIVSRQSTGSSLALILQSSFWVSSFPFSDDLVFMKSSSSSVIRSSFKSFLVMILKSDSFPTLQAMSGILLLNTSHALLPKTEILMYQHYFKNYLPLNQQLLFSSKSVSLSCSSSVSTLHPIRGGTFSYEIVMG